MEKYSLNNYSCTPAQLSNWLSAMHEAYVMCGTKDQRMKFTIEGETALKGLFRGAFVKRDIGKGDIFTSQDVFCAIPAAEGQVIARQLSKYVSFTALNDIQSNQPVMTHDVKIVDKRETVQGIVQRIKESLENANISAPFGVVCAAYSHYGLDRFDEVGAVLINLVNREYSKTLLIMFPGQRYPLHYHKHKEETFNILSGELLINIENETHSLKKGDLLTVHRGQNHSFGTDKGVILEEIATTYIDGDSYYDDTDILDSHERKVTFGLY
jgi:N-acetylneuraminate synthase